MAENWQEKIVSYVCLCEVVHVLPDSTADVTTGVLSKLWVKEQSLATLSHRAWIPLTLMETCKNVTISRQKGASIISLRFTYSYF